MSVPSAAALLQAWETAQGRPPWERALVLLHAAHPELGLERLGSESVGWRNRALLALRVGLFGPTFAGDGTCPACAARVETTFAASALPRPHADDPGARPDEPMRVALDGWEVVVRPPCSRDLAAVAGTADVAAARGALLERCVVTARHGEIEATGAALPEHVAAAVLTRLAADDPAGDVELALRCPDCGHQWSVELDVEAFLWEELGVWIGQLLRDVHVLAAAYGWAEADILGLSPWRRRAYLELAG